MPKTPRTPAADAAPTPATPANRFVCIHGHFYQPPRENPWLETVEVQDSAAPYHDWNDRITAECYAPNGASRIQNAENEIVRILNNYARMSFNFGPTLLSWLAGNAPRAYHMILDADKASATRFGGHGSALAQVYNHIIMPLASTRDALTQIRWGIADFVSRFGRRPEGMWLAETAVNRHVLDLLAQEGILYTILAPNQCARVRPVTPPDAGSSSTLNTASLKKKESSSSNENARASVLTTAAPGSAVALDPAAPPPVAAATDSRALSSELSRPWQETSNASVDPTQPYRVNLDAGRSIAVFFYDGPASRAIAFEGLLDSGEKFGQRLLECFHPVPTGELDRAQLSHVATDGESYGHHHKHGEMALSFAMHYLEDNHLARLTNYAEFLDLFPPTWEAEVAEDTSWSCAHGIERWRSNCGCNGGKVGWNQEWRAPLRQALDFLRDATAPLAERLADGLLIDLWTARDAYINIILDRSPESIDRFLATQATRKLTQEERTTILELMELERHTQLMYTSCGWFFDEISGIETVQIIAYAGRVLQLASELFGAAGSALERQFLAILGKAISNVPEMGTGADIYTRYVNGMRIGLEQVGAHYAISSIFRNYPEDGHLFCFDVHRDSHEVFASGRGKVALGRARIQSHITEEAEDICFAVLHLGDQNLSAAVRGFSSADIPAFEAFSADVRAAIRKANLPEIIRLIDRFFTPSPTQPLPEAVPHITLNPTDPEPGQSEDIFGASQSGIAHTLAPPAPSSPSTPIAYSLTSLFADEQHRILETILNQTIGEMEHSLRKIYEDHASLLHFLTESGMAPPPALALASSFAINASLRRAIEDDPFDPAVIEDLLTRAEADHVTLDGHLLGFAAGLRMKKAMIRLEAAAAGDHPASTSLHQALDIADSIRTMPFEVNIWQAQNIWNDLLRRVDATYWSNEWKEGFKRLGEAMNICVDQLVVEEGVSTF